MTTHLNLKGADGIDLHAAVAGESGPVVLFLHGFPEFWAAWHRQLPVFAHGRRAVALDLPGYNESSKPGATGRYTLAAIAEDISCVLHHLCSDRKAVLVGHDWGGLVGWALARRAPHLLERMVIINAPHPTLFWRELTRNPRQWFSSLYAGCFQVRGVAELALRFCDHALLRALLFGTCRKPEAFDPTLRAAYQAAWKAPGGLRAQLSYYRNLAAFRAEAREAAAAAIRVPTLVLWGRRDPALSPRCLAGLHALVCDVRIEQHPRATHWVVHEEPEWVNAQISAFLEEPLNGVA